MKRYRNPFLFVLIAGVLCIAVSGNGFGDNIRVEKPLLYPDTKENRAFLDSALREAAFFIDKMYEGRIRISGYGVESGDGSPQEKADFLLRINAVNTPDSKVISLNLTSVSGDAAAGPINFMRDWGPGFGPDFGRSIFYLWGASQDFSNFGTAETPVFIDEFPFDLIPPASLPVKGVQLYPYSLAVKRNGNVIVGANALSMEMDKNFRIAGFPGKVLTEKGNYTYAFDVDVTPGGTVLFKPSTGSEVYILAPGTDNPRRLRTGLSGATGAAMLPDGSIVLVDSNQKKAVVFGNRSRKTIDVFPTQYSYVTAVTSDPDGNIWIKDSMDNHIRIYSPEGILVDSILPLTDFQKLSGTKGISVLPNGDFLLLSQASLQKFKRNGEPIWNLDQVPSPEGGAFTTIMDTAEDPSSGFIYLTDYTGRRVFKLLDTAYAEKRGLITDNERMMIDINRKLFSNPYDTHALEQKAVFYEKAGAVEAAMANWERVIEADPYNTEADTRLTELELELLRKQADTLRLKTLGMLEQLGPESARKYYSETVQLYEQIMYKAPDDAESKRELQELQERFRMSEEAPRKRLKPLQVTGIALDKLFPSLLQYYQKHPAGSVSVKNPLQQPVTGLKAEIFIKDFMDFPSVSAEIPELDPGESVDIDLPVRLNRSVFAVEEDLPVQVKISISYTADDQPETVDQYKTVTLFRRTALSWDDSRKLAAFIVPNEEIVSQFSHRVVSALGSKDTMHFSSAFLRAVTISDALGTYGIEYIEDPESPISSVLNDMQSVDTVRFPRTTLYYKSGDCDDSTALLCSLLESAGISTAIMTSPGHVFLAFDSGEPSANSWQFESSTSEIIVHDGTVWIPLEATLLSDGFYRSWESASETLQKYRDSGKVEFLPVHDAWSVYPALPLPGGAFTIIEPLPGRVEERREASLDDMKQAVYQEAAGSLNADLQRASSRRKVKILNRLGILNARYGDLNTAENNFRDAMNLNPESVSSYINLANLLLLKADTGNALKILEQGEGKNPESVLLNVLLAKTYYQIGNRTKAANYLTKVERKTAEFSDDLAYIRGKSASRAADAGSTESFFWDSEE